MRKIFLICMALAAIVPCFSQKTKKEKRDERKQRVNALIKQEEEGVITYHKHTVYGVKLTSDGYGAFMEIGRANSIRKALLFQIDIAERKHPREDKQSNPFIPTSPFIFGKINYFYPVKLGVQQQLLVGNKTNRNGVSVTANFGGGLSMGLVRPYFLEISDVGGGNRKTIRYESGDSLLFSNGTALRGASVSGAGFGKGWKQLKVTPGLYAKAGLRFDYGKYNEMVNALEVGISTEAYSKKVPQLVFSDPRQIFFNFYVSVMFGKRK